LKNYIEYWFKKEIDKLTKEGQETTVEIVPINVNEESSSSFHKLILSYIFFMVCGSPNPNPLEKHI
jgi:hypothetical protein